MLAGSHCRRTLWSPRHRQLSASISGRHALHMRKGTAPTVPYPECHQQTTESIVAVAPTAAMEPPAMEDLVSG